MIGERVGRAEFDMLRGAVAENVRRLDSIDQGGTRGVGVLSVQVADVIKDVAELGAQIESHRREHEATERARVTGRRWLIGTGLAALALVESPLLYLLAHVR